MRRKWKLGCGASLEVLETPNNGDGVFEVRIVGSPRQGWFAEVEGWVPQDDVLGELIARGKNVRLVVVPRAIPKLIKILQYLEKQGAA